MQVICVIGVVVALDGVSNILRAVPKVDEPPMKWEFSKRPFSELTGMSVNQAKSVTRPFRSR